LVPLKPYENIKY